jgi:hypothetical protein
MANRIAMLLALVMVVGLPSGVALGQGKGADKPLASQELDAEGVVADVVQSERKDNVLTVRVRFRNTGDKPAKLSLVDAQGYVHTYLVSAKTKYHLLTDDRGQQVATPRDGGGWLVPTIKPKSSWSWWGKVPAPPADRKDYSLYLKVGPPIDNIPIIDK